MQQGHVVVGVDCFTDYYSRELKDRNIAGAYRHSNFELVERDLAIGDLTDLLTGIDGVFHLAAQPGVRGSWGPQFDRYVRNNIAATQHLLESIVKVDAAIPVVYASSSSVYGNATTLPVSEKLYLQPVSPYGVSKLAAEHLCYLYGRAHGLTVSSLRYFTVYGPRQRPDMAFTRFITGALWGRPLQVLGDGTQSRDFTFVLDAVTATIAALGSEPGVYNVGGGEVASINAVIDTICEITGAEVRRVYSGTARGDVAHTWADTEGARQSLHWAPTYGLRAGLTEHVKWVRSLGEDSKFRDLLLSETSLG